MSNTNRDYAILYDIKNSSLILSRPLVFYITDKNTSNIFIRLVTKTNVGDGIDQYTDIENASGYVLRLRVIKPNGEVTSIKATQREPESIFEFDLTESFKDIPGVYICELMISTIVSGRQELITSDSFTYEVKRSILSKIDQIIEHKDTTVEKLLNELDATEAELSSRIEVEKSRIDLLVQNGSTNTEGNAELLDIRIDKNGTLHETAGSATRTVILEDDIVTPDSITDEYIDVLQSTKLYINQYQTGYYPDSGLINRVELTGHVCTDPIPIDKLYDEITVPLDDELKGQAFIFLDSNKKAYYSKNVNGIKTNADMQNYLSYNENTKEYKLLIKKYFQEVGRVAYVSFNFLSDRKYIKKLADNKVLKWLKVEGNNLSDDLVTAKHIKNRDILCDYIDIYDKYISAYTSNEISYIDSDTQVATSCLNINNLSDTLSFKVTSDLKGQVVVLKNNLDEYFVSLNANLIINKDFRQLNGYMTYNSQTQFATIDIKKLRENMGKTTITGLAVSSDLIENIRGFMYKELKWLKVPKNEYKEEKIEIRLLDEYVLLKDVEYNFYTCQTVMCSRKLPDKYMVIWQYNGSGGTSYNDSIKILETSTGVHYLTVKVFKEEEGELVLVDSKTTKISIVENTVANKNILFIGDSRIEDGTSPWPARVQLVTTIKNTLDASNTF